jgi:hypothetical protein
MFRYLTTVPFEEINSYTVSLAPRSHCSTRVNGAYKNRNSLDILSYELASLARRWYVNKPHPFRYNRRNMLAIANEIIQ